MTHYRYFDTGDKAVDQLLSQLDHMSSFYEISELRQFDDWLVGFIERWKALPPTFQSAIRNNAYIGDLHHRMGMNWVKKRFEKMQNDLDSDLQKVLETKELAGRSNIYGGDYGRDGKYSDRKNTEYLNIDRDFETTGEAIQRLCNDLMDLGSLFYDGRERQIIIASLKREAQGHAEISSHVSQLLKLLSKKRISDFSEAKSDAYGIISRIKGYAYGWHRKRH